MPRIPAIPTRYKGYKFRSRLEARWAVFFDAMEAAWEYEPEGYVLQGGGGYLPDFYLPETHWLLDIKPKTPEFDGEPTDISSGTKEAQFAAQLGEKDPRFAVVWGSPGPITGCSVRDSYAAAVLCDGPYYFCLCPRCGKLGLEFSARGERICRHTDLSGKHCNHDDPRLVNAFNAARAARFGT